MKEIEFRVYVKDKHKIYKVKEIDFNYKCVKFEEENKPTDTMLMFNQVELMQYTGLKDKNGKKIFEGDIVKDILGQIGQIIYKEKYSAFVVDKWEVGYALWFDKGIEVIGNIYDNPKLLKGE